MDINHHPGGERVVYPMRPGAEAVKEALQTKGVHVAVVYDTGARGWILQEKEYGKIKVDHHDGGLSV